MSVELKKLYDIFSGSGEPLVICENRETFTTVMYIFTQYEKHVSTIENCFHPWQDSQ